jgi:uncharacterized membrane protein
LYLRHYSFLFRGFFPQVLLLLGWTLLGAVLRFTHLGTKPLWTDEFATVVFSLGQSFRTIPLNQIITADSLLQPLHLGLNAQPEVVVAHLMRESTHPPLYFVLAHLWMHLVAKSGELVSADLVRSLPALLGVLSIPAMFGLGWVALRSPWAGHMAAAWMAVSPYGVYLAQEARHYTLAIMWIIASLACFAIALRCIANQHPLPIRIALSWVVINGLGMATHYFFALTLSAEALVLICIGGLNGKQLIRSQSANRQEPYRYWGRFLAVGLGTAGGCSIWLPALQASQQNEITQWIWQGDRNVLSWLDPVFNSVAGVITMLLLLPIQGIPGPLQVMSAVLLLLFSIGVIRILMIGMAAMGSNSCDRRVIWGLVSFTVAAVGLQWLLDYGWGTDFARSFRYHFVYFPAVVMVFTAGFWSYGSRHPYAGRKSLNWTSGSNKAAIVGLWGIALLGALTVSFHLGFQKNQRPDLVAQAIQQHSHAPVLIAIAHRTHGQTGRLMGIAWEQRQIGANWQYYLDHQACPNHPKHCNTPTPFFQAMLSAAPRPLEIWLVNFQGTADLTHQRCSLDQNLRTQRIDGYKYQRYWCPLTFHR